jgi:hypothetical protein
LGFPDYQVLAADQGISYEAVCSRLYRARKSLVATNPRQFIALVLRVLGVAGDPGRAFFHPERGVRGTNEEVGR